MSNIEIRHFHLFCGAGGGAAGFNAGAARVGTAVARFRCLGGIDSDAAAVRDFSSLAGVPGTCLDLFDREQFMAFHGHEPPREWREATPADLHAAAGHERPHIVFTSPPCKGFSGLLPPARAGAPRYAALNRLTVRGVWLALEAWADDPPEFVLLENVPRIQSRGRDLLDTIVALLRSYGYAVAETTHDCGELGGLAQTRRRFLLVARHQAKVPPFLYEPGRRALRPVGSVLEQLPMPGDPRGGAMHGLPALRWLTWVRLALIPAGSDWRALKGIDPADYGIVPATGSQAGVTVEDPRPPSWGDYHALGVRPWGRPAETVTGRAQPGAGAFSVADPRLQWADNAYRNKLRVVGWNEPGGCVTGSTRPASGAPSVADPRPSTSWSGSGKYRVAGWGMPTGTVIAASDTGNGASAVADPRRPRFNNVYRIVKRDEASPAVTAGAGPSSGGMAIDDPRQCGKREGGQYVTQGTYGVTPWDATSRAVPGRAKVDTGPWSVADPRLPGPSDRPDPAPVLLALDGTWHRPFTTLELAALQGFPLFDEDTGALVLDGKATGAWRERIGNAVPPPAATAIASVMGEALLLAGMGTTFSLSATPVWVRPVALALAVQPSGAA